MSCAFLVFVRFHDGRYHGRPEWPPSPARLMQALVAGAASGRALVAEDRAALAWLERLAPPVLAAPAVRIGSGFKNYVPNNDLDAVGGDPRRVAEIRAPKSIRPWLFDARVPLIYAWRFDGGGKHAEQLCGIAEKLYQLGRGVDMAWAWAEVVDAAELDWRLAAHGGVMYRPAGGVEGAALPCPQSGSLASLEARFAATGKRFTALRSGRQVQQLFSQAPKPRFGPVLYNSPPQQLLFDLRRIDREAGFAPWPLVRVCELVERLRAAAAARLRTALPPEQAACVERTLIGRGATEADKAARIRIIPIASIGSPHVVRSIRRVLVEAPANCALSADDVAWAFSGLDLNVDPQTGEVVSEDGSVLTPADDDSMLRHYGIDEARGAAHRLWRTVTPAALPERAGRRRIDPGRLRAEVAAARGGRAEFKEAKSSSERGEEETRAASAVMHALRHAGIPAPVEATRVQREPFEGRGARAEAFAPGGRFGKERLWHVEIAFAAPVAGPLVVGDGRYLGLGVMAPVREAWRDVVAFAVPAAAEIADIDGSALAHAVRRALMAISREVKGEAIRLFSGHEPDGGRAASGRHEHIFIAADDSNRDGRVDRVVVAAPWVCDRSLRPTRAMRRDFDAVVSLLETVRAGRLGVIALGRPAALSVADALVGPARVWENRTPYRATRHAGRRKDPKAALVRDLMTECTRRGFPKPEVEILNCSAVPNGGGLVATARLRFAAAVNGPLLLGRDSHRGGGVFAAAQ
jgi:CRISPR-associated protein Csb2